MWHFATNSGEEGITIDKPVLNFPKVIERKNGIVQKHAKGIEFLMKKNKVEWIKGFGSIVGPGKVEVKTDKGTQVLETKNILVATGSTARMLPGLTPDAKTILTNIEILDLQAVPKSLMIIGAGAVGVEFASMFRRFGTEVSIFEALPRIVPVEDEEVSKELLRIFKKQGIRVETGAKCDNVQKSANGVKMRVTLSNGKTEEVEAEKLLVAIGRAPNTAGIGLEKTKVRTDRGFIFVNEFQQTDEPGIYAIGDVVAGTPQLAHVATAQGMVAVAKIAGKPAIPIRRNRIPGATYTDPGIGSVGLTEAQAKEKGYKVKVGKFPFMANSKATILGSHDGFVKIVSDEKYGEILGVHIIGPEAFELISEAVAAMESEATVETMMNTIHAHPTIYEAIGEAFNNVYGLAINV
jgi:dihydrolipoamide dehydrogenase